MEDSLTKILVEIEDAKKRKLYKTCVKLYLRATKICQILGNEKKLLEYAKAAKEYRFKLEYNGSLEK